MRQPNFQHLKIILALMPLLIRNAPFLETIVTAFLIAAAVLGSTSLFVLMRTLFPKQLIHISFLLFIAAVYQSLSYFFSVPALCLVSFFLLFDWNDVDANRLGAKTLPLLSRLITFVAAAAFMSAAQVYFTKRMGGAAFKQPFRILVLLSFGAFVLHKIFPLKRRAGIA
jgi:hypothetical protein